MNGFAKFLERFQKFTKTTKVLGFMKASDGCRSYLKLFYSHEKREKSFEDCENFLKLSEASEFAKILQGFWNFIKLLQDF